MPFYVTNSMSFVQTVGHEVTVTLIYTSYLLAIEVLLMLIPIPKAIFWYIFVVAVIDSVMHDKTSLIGQYISLGVQLMRVVANMWTLMVTCSAAFLLLYNYGKITTKVKANIINVNIMFDDKAYFGTVVFGFFLFYGLAAVFTLLRTMINISIAIGKAIAIIFGKIEIEDEIPIDAESINQIESAAATEA